MLPRLPDIKTCIFTKRIIAFNETFTPLGGNCKSKPGKPIGILWHEAVTGRDAGDIASAYYKLIRNVRHWDCKHFIFWADNSTVQNENWLLYTTLYAEVNQKSGPDTIAIKYFEKGHTFMSADSFHHLVEKEICKMKFLYDFDDFVSCVSNKEETLILGYSDILLFENCVSQGKFTNKPLLESVQCQVYKR